MDDPRAREMREIERAVAPTLDRGLDDWVPVDTLIWNSATANSAPPPSPLWPEPMTT
ncbi:hypothetical protein [Amycolatopsis sp. NPDC049868]|uniref:hypothetical protein n=1 Tax=Amycolatopsis sp. NPDC049868 TaxID=3363934 RepID=UPI003798ADE1